MPPLPPVVVDVSGPAVPRLPRREIAKFVTQSVNAVTSRAGLPSAAMNVSVVFVNDRDMKRLNARYRGERKTTDVLTFEGENSPEGASLGEIVISLDQARRQARAERHSLATELRYLLLHGVIHAFGLDHETDGGEMDALEMRVRSRLDLE
ncbi:MAG TPA: rRNA maturation RNase YbeY [Thermoanaerobaculia bacterium]|nr:rRNA maturation RNase YbeY [Thermoanaerobaculia bacterium]